MNRPVPGMGSPEGWEHGDRDTPLHVLRRCVESIGDRVMLEVAGETFTYRRIDELSDRLARSLISLGVVPGHTLTTMLDNNVDAVVVWLAINKVGAVSVPVNTALRGEFLRHQLSDADSEIFICESDYLDRVVAVLDRLPRLNRLMYRGALATPPAVVHPDVAVESLDRWRVGNSTAIERLPDPSDLACLIYTSGTTGPSKGCMISHNYMCNLARQQLRAAPAGPGDVVWTPLPFFHMNALCTGLISTMMAGATLSLSPRFSVSNFWPEVERTGATVISILGSMGNLLAQAADNDAMRRCFGQVHTVRGNPFSLETKETWRTRFGARQIGSNGYGLTEAAVVTSLAAGEPVNPGSSGRRIPDFDVRIFDDQDHEVAAGVSGEIVVRPLRPDIMFQGYWRRPEETLKIMRDLWLHTGDIGKFDEDGFFYFVDRKKDYLRRRGENISSFELEATFHSHPDIEEAAIHAVPSPVGEDDVKLTAVLRSNAMVTPESVCAWAIDQVPYYAVPRYVEFRLFLPKNPQGRVLKYQLRDEGVTPGTWDREASDLVVVKR